MPRRSRAAWAAVALLAAAGAGPAAAADAASLEVGMADDRLMFAGPASAHETARTWAHMGVDSVRLHVRWVAVAPSPGARSKPRGFDDADADDPRYRWAYIDHAVAALVDAGLEPVLAITGSGPLWATERPASGNPRALPSARAFGRFARAVAQRYGSHADRYVVWNEPNQAAWLQPQLTCSAARGCQPIAPHVYRDLLRAAYPAIKRADPRAEVLGGALAPRGNPPRRTNSPLRPLAFLRAFACVDKRYRPIRTGRCKGFLPARMDGVAHHPHPVRASPSAHSAHPDEVALGDLGRLETVLDRLQDRRRIAISGGRRAPIHLTEFGYQTDPPDPYSGITLRRQAHWTSEATYLAAKDPRVKSLVQYAFQDEPVDRKAGAGRRAFAGWQSGLLDVRGREKPAYFVFSSPFVAHRPAGRVQTELWGQARQGAQHEVLVERRLPGREGWELFTRVGTDPRGTFSVHRRITATADFRYSYPVDGGTAVSPVVRVRAAG
ncbi:hypothetical protein [Conexibacter sp. SYSU D00693]|uniref:hypothetical protein n=1 Tax=Conexibacter sp. SYSU D00693 TaxID=2812560 RepID=UPI00196B855D|nr:hypothetical protein [Conexibacter sp. SYSU D00693]